MQAISRALTITLGAGMFVSMFVSNANAGCGDLSNLKGPFVIIQPGLDISSPAFQSEAESARQASGAPSIVGLWNFQFVSEGNTGHTPPIPDNALLDFGYQVWHSDNTEFTNSGGHNPATQNYCLGAWGKTGFNAYELNHFALQYDTSGNVTGNANIKQQVTVSPSGDSFSGTFTIDIYDVRA